MRALCFGLAAFLLWTALTQPPSEFRYTTPAHATINTQNGGTP